MNHIIVGAIVGGQIMGYMIKSLSQLDQTNDKMRRELLRANKILIGVAD